MKLSRRVKDWLTVLSIAFAPTLVVAYPLLTGPKGG